MNQLPESDTRPVVFFDFDGTLTTGDTLMPFLKFVVGKPIYYVKLVLLSPILVAYFAKVLRNDIAKQIVLKRYLAGYRIDELFLLGKRFSEDVIPTMLREETVTRLRWHQEQGHVCVVVSASLDVYLTEWANLNGFYSCISSRLKKSQTGIVTGELIGENCFGDEKVANIKKFLSSGQNLTYAYGDTKGDFSMLFCVDKGMILKNGTFLKIDSFENSCS